MNADFKINDQGTVVVFTPLTDVASIFLSRCDTEPWQWMGPSLVVDHRPAQALLEAIQAEGMLIAPDRKYTLKDVGCYVDSVRGRYCIDRIVEIAEAHGFTHDVEQTPTGMPGDYLTYADYEFTGELEDEIDSYMNKNFAVEGAYWGRSEQSDWGLWTTEEEVA